MAGSSIVRSNDDPNEYRGQQMVSKRLALITLTASWIGLGNAAYAFEFNGAWATDANVCDKVFVKKGNKISFAPNSDQYGGGFIVEGNRVHGQLQSCNIKARKEDAKSIHVLAACTTDIMGSNIQLSAKIINDNSILRYFPGMPEDLGMPYSRCVM